jgi:hypothetical protein
MSLEPRLKPSQEILHSVEPTQDIDASWAQKIEEAINGLAQTQTLLMNKVTNMERIQQQIMRPPYKGQPQRKNPTWKPRPPNEQRVPNTLAPTNVINPKRPLGVYLVGMLIGSMNVQEIVPIMVIMKA